MLHPAIAELNASFLDPFTELGRSASGDHDAVVLSWPSVPIELIHACGLRAVLARGAPASTPVANERLEPGVFPSRLHQLVEAALTGKLAHVAGIVLPRTSDPDYKCFLYLREFVRRGIGGPYPPIELFDLLQTAGQRSADYNRARAQLLLDKLACWSGSLPHPDELRAVVVRTNAARAAARRLQALRSDIPRLAGAEALPLLGAIWQLPGPRYAALADNAAAEVRTRTARPGPRIFVAGAPVDTPALHAAVEARHATVVSELGPFGNDAAGDDIPPCEDMLGALAQRCRISPTTARTPLAMMRRRIEGALADVDAVVVNQTADDATFGWDYPWLCSVLARRAIPHMVVTQNAKGMPDTQLMALDALLEIATHRPAARHG